MGKHDRCCVGICNKVQRYPHLSVKRVHVEGNLIWHRFPCDPKKFDNLKGRVLREDLNSLTFNL